MTITPSVRAAVLQRDGYACVCCGRSIIGQRYSLQHRVRKGMGGSRVSWIDQPQNLITMLGTGTSGCHGRVERRGQEDKKRGYWIPAHPEIDPQFVPVLVATEFGDVTVWLTPDGKLSNDPPAEPELPFDARLSCESGECGCCTECLAQAAVRVAINEDQAHGPPF